MHEQHHQQSQMISDSLGDKLKEIRQKHNLSLKAVAKSLNLPEHIIDCIEKNEFNKLPGYVYTRGYVRAYAKFLQLDVNVISHELNYYLHHQTRPMQKLGDSRNKKLLSKLTTFQLHLADHKRAKIILPTMLIAGGIIVILAIFWFVSAYNDASVNQKLSVSSQQVSSK